MTSSADTYSAFETQLLASYCVMVETEHLTIGHQVTMQPEPPLMNRLLSESASHVGYRQLPSVTWN